MAGIRLRKCYGGQRTKKRFRAFAGGGGALFIGSIKIL